MKTETTEGQTETLTSRKLQEWPKECSEMQHNNIREHIQSFD